MIAFPSYGTLETPEFYHLSLLPTQLLPSQVRISPSLTYSFVCIIFFFFTLFSTYSTFKRQVLSGKAGHLWKSLSVLWTWTGRRELFEKWEREREKLLEKVGKGRKERNQRITRAEKRRLQPSMGLRRLHIQLLSQ